MKKIHDLNGEIGLFENDDNDMRNRTKLQSPEFDLRRGSHLALSNSSELSSYHQTLALSCSPLTLHFKHHSMKSTHISYGLIRNDTMLDMLVRIPFENQNYSQPLECIVEIHKDEGNYVERDTSGSSISINSAYVQKMISPSSLPGIDDAFTFAPPTTELLDALNTDFRLCPSLLHAVAILRTGSLIITTDNAILTLTAEVYARAKCLDSHGETNMKSLPSFTNLFPNLLSVGIHEETGGGAAKMKPKIGIKTINVLITMSSLIKKNRVFVGPETSISTGFHNYAVFKNCKLDSIFTSCLYTSTKLSKNS